MHSLPDGLHNEDIIWRGKPQRSLVLIYSILGMMITYAAYLFTTYALNLLLEYYREYSVHSWLRDPEFLILHSLAFIGAGILTAFAVLRYRVFSCEYVITSRGFYVRKGEKWTTYALRGIHEIKVKRLIPAFELASSLEIYLESATSQDKGTAVWAWSKKRDHVFLWFPEDPSTVKKTLEQAVNAARMPKVK